MGTPERRRPWVIRNIGLLMLYAAAGFYSLASRAKFGVESIGFGLGLVAISIGMLVGAIRTLTASLGTRAGEARHKVKPDD